ncbi:uncharacterized protein LOC129771093 [Toxorhynchites rutilus septentrionalis]|uniref:uncharacterized protein LOC129771093 n=1 Tax=Toxorhynchites rutilus septentrionalis TaxID=329112 RepID=UPI00247B230B|nr:uncharacterized protein LOC129771093 [Toxorhynchites rutilus septentrionalis]
MFRQRWTIIWTLLGVLLLSAVSDAKSSCIQCTSANNTSDCAQGNITATDCEQEADQPCFWRLANNSIVRGCVQDLSGEDQTKCTNATDTTCMTCNQPGCNSAKWLKCYTCLQSDPNCGKEQTDSSTTAFCKHYQQNDRCYSKVVEETVVRGCSSDIANVETECTNVKYCETCQGDVCNKLSKETLQAYTKCHRCNSTNPMCINGTTEAVDCDQREDVCYSRINNNLLERDCLSKLSLTEQTKCKLQNDTTCMTCSATGGCNKESWLRCHQCMETNEATCAAEQTDDSKAQFCKTYKAANLCYARLESSKVVRGCEADLGTNKDACENNRQCRSCTEDACNRGASSTLDSKDRCLQCRTDKDTAGSCLLGTAQTQPCAKESGEECYSKVIEGGILSRGCKGDLAQSEVQACTGTTCEICKAEGCNKDIFPKNRLRCYQCKAAGETEKICTEQLTGDKSSNYCQLYIDKDQCYARDVNKIFERGCQSDLGNGVNACDGLNQKQCVRCSTGNCNGISKARLNSAGKHAVSWLLVALCSVFVILGVFK